MDLQRENPVQNHKTKTMEKSIGKVADAWVRICLFHIRQKHQEK